MKIIIEQYKSEDCTALAELFFETVHRINRKDYSPRQLKAWAPQRPDIALWNASLERNLCLVARCGDRIVGFTDMREDGYLDRLYVHHRFQRRGIARMLTENLERRAREKGTEKIFTEASITALPFFEAQGYRRVRIQSVKRKDVEMTNYLMEKSLSAR